MVPARPSRIARARRPTLPILAAGAVVSAGMRCLGFTLSTTAGVAKPNAIGVQRARARHVTLARGGDDDYDYEAAEVIGELKVGQKYQGVVTKIMNFGCFVDIGASRDGLVPVSKLKDGSTRDLAVEDFVEQGQGVTVWVCESKDDKLTLSMTPNKIYNRNFGPPDLSGFVGISPETLLDGRVVNVRDFGAFVEVSPPSGGPPAQGLVHITQLKDGFCEKAEDEVSVGQQVKVRVLNVDTTTNKMGLSMKSAGGTAGGPQKTSVSAFADIPKTEFLPGIVKNLANFGAFVEIEAPTGEKIDGLVHISQITEGFIEDPAEELEVDQEVRVRILEVNEDTGKLSLSMKEIVAVEE